MVGAELKRKWSPRRQWVLIAAAFAVNISLIVVAWKWGR